MASVFDLERLTWLEDIGVKRYKIASRSIYDTDLIEAVKKTKKPMLISLGKWKGNKLPVVNSSTQVDFMHCVSNYPASLSELNLNMVDFKNIKGFSDHSLGITGACAAMVMGCSIIEKHFTYDKNAYGPDHLCSMNIRELENLKKFRDDWEVMSDPNNKYGIL
jgi:sialic acid synthase SpsE